MKLFQCDHCGHALFFEDSACLRCGRGVGYCVESQKLVTLPEQTSDAQSSFALPGLGQNRYVLCRNQVEYAACNWLVLVPNPEAPEAERQRLYCRSCELTELIPDLSNPANLEAWIQVERAKRRLLYTIHALNLPLASRRRDSERGLAFRFLRGTKRQPVMTGHSAGIITLNVAEAHAAFRENMREKLGEAYRTVLGHLRHEIGHYYWDRLIAQSPALSTFRSLFGDERQDYERAVRRHYGDGPKTHWADSFISAYATMHPWEDWAETWAHYLHMQDTLETAKSHGVAVRAPGKQERRVATEALAFRDFESLSQGWQAVTLTLNSMSRSMGLPDAYPFVASKSKPVQDKLRFIHRLIHERPESPKSHRRTPASSRAPALPGE